MKTIDDAFEDSEIFYLIVYPNGDRSKLDIAQAQRFDVDGYDLASKFCYPDEQTAFRRARVLALQYGKDFEDTREEALLE